MAGDEKVAALTGAVTSPIARPHWRWIVRERSARVDHDMHRIRASGRIDDATAADLEAAHVDLRQALELSVPRRRDVWDRLTRTSCDAAFRRLHTAEALVTARLPEPERTDRVRELRFKAESVLDRDDPVLRTPESDEQVRQLALPIARKSDEHVRQLVLQYRGAVDDMYKQANSYRSRLIMLTGIVTLFVLVLVLAAAFGVFSLEVTRDGQLTFGGSPDWSFSGQRALAAAAVCTFGAVGGLLAGAGPVSRLGGVYNPSNLPWYSLLLKIQMGALCGILGVLFVLGEFAPEISPELFWKDAVLWGLVFGAAQQAVTRIVDHRVGTMVSSPTASGTASKPASSSP